MKTHAKDRIKHAFMNLLEERPLAQITVKDIVAVYGLNRNTFYYHYADLPSLIEEIITDEVARITSEYRSFDSLEDCLDVVLSFALENRKAALHLYRSANRDLFEQYFLQITDHVIRAYLSRICQEQHLNPDPADLEIHIHFFKCLVYGQTLDWLRAGMPAGLKDTFHRLCELYQGMPEEILRRNAGNGTPRAFPHIL